MRIQTTAALAFITLSTSTSLVHATKIKFGLVAFPTTTALPRLLINNSPVGDLQQLNPNSPFFTATFEAQQGSKYKYSVDGISETFDRDLTAQIVSEAKTKHDFYGRAVTVRKMLNLPWPMGDQWTRGVYLTPLFDDSYVPTVHLYSPDVDAVNNMWFKMNSTVPMTMTVITADNVQVYNNVGYSISAAGRKNNYAKQAYKLKLPPQSHLFGRDEWKLRNSEEDPTQLREKVYGQLLNAAGCPVIQANNVRLYVNMNPVGTYVMDDNADQSSFIKALFHAQPGFGLGSNARVGTLLQSNSFDFVYKGDDPAAYNTLTVSEAGSNPTTNPLQSLIAFTKYLNQTGTDDVSIDKLGEKFDVETFLRAMAFEYLNVHWDGYWEQATNYILYEDPITTKWYFIDQDFDMTMGVATSAAYVGTNVTSLSYKRYGGNSKGQPRPLLTKILAAPKYSARFETILKSIVSKMYNPATLGERIKADHARMRDEVAWDRSQKRRHSGKPDNWVIADFDANLMSPVRGAEFGFYSWIDQRSKAVAQQFGLTLPSKAEAAPDPITSVPGNDPAASINDIVRHNTEFGAGNAVTARAGWMAVVSVASAVTIVAAFV